MMKSWAFLLALLTSALVSACAHSPDAPRVDNASDIELPPIAKRFGYPSCTVSLPLTPDEVLRAARLGGDPHPEQRPEWSEMVDMIEVGDQLRLVSCLPKGRGGVVFFALFRESIMIAEMHTVILD